MSIQQSLWDAAMAQQDADRAPRRLEVLPTAAREENHRQGQRAAILAALKLSPLTAVQLFQIAGPGFSSRLYELRKSGYQIKTRMVGRHGIYELEESRG